MKKFFCLTPEVIYLNHGSYGACPREILETQHQFNLQLEAQPVRFFTEVLPYALKEAREQLQFFLHAKKNSLVLIPNATHGVNIALNSIHLEKGDEILTSNHEYGACLNAIHALCQKTGAKIRVVPISLPLDKDEIITKYFTEAITSKTKLLFLSHITSATAQIFPVAKICKAMSEKNITTLIDGAHAPGQFPLDLSSLGSDFYTGNCHKWMCAPKGCAFLFASESAQKKIQPPIVGWGSLPEKQWNYGNSFTDSLEYPGTANYSAFLSLVKTLEFLKTHHWENIQKNCHDLLAETHEKILEITKEASLYQDSGKFLQMASFTVKESVFESLKKDLWALYKIEMPFMQWENKKILRISIQAYNTRQDCETFLEILKKYCNIAR